MANPPTSQTALTSGVLPRGLGYGPPEINLLPALTLAGTNAFAIYNNLFQGSGTLAVGGRTMAGRYGQFGLGGTGPQPGLPGQLAPLTFNKWYEFNGSYGGNFWNFAGTGFPLDAYGTPPDIFGCGAVGVDPAGRPLYFRMGGPINNSPYDLNLSRNAPRGLPTFALPSGTLMLNNPFSPAEFETILRPFDRDAPTLPNRLVGLCGVTITVTPTYAYTYSVLQATRHDLTTESWDSPTPPAALPKLARYQLATELVAMGMAASNTYTPPRHITNLFTAYGLYAANTSNTYVWDNVAPEMLAGLKLNLNQPLGAWRADPNQPSTATSPWFQQYAKPGAAHELGRVPELHSRGSCEHVVWTALPVDRQAVAEHGDLSLAAVYPGPAAVGPLSLRAHDAALRPKFDSAKVCWERLEQPDAGRQHIYPRAVAGLCRAADCPMGDQRRHLRLQ